jgi:hypothetical protein
MVAYADRWSRDNAKSKDGLEAFRKQGVGFFVGSMEMNLYDPQARFILGMNAEVGEFLALQAAKKSLESRIERARNNIPSSGGLPFGRTYDRLSGQWGIDAAKQAVIQHVADRYLAGESLPQLAKEYGMSHSSLCNTLRLRCGRDWVVSFDDDRLNIHEVVSLTIPPLLDEATIRKVTDMLAGNRRRQGVSLTCRGLRKDARRKNEYLLSGYLFCQCCGYAVVGRADSRGVAHYCHTHHKSSRNCPGHPRVYVDAYQLEQQVIGQLFNLFGNPAAIERSIRDAIPDCDSLLKQRDRLKAQLAEVERGRGRILDLVIKGAVSQSQAEKKLGQLNQRQQSLERQLALLQKSLAEVPDPDSLRRYVDQIEEYIFVFDEAGNRYAGGNDVQSYIMMTQRDKRQLLRAVFANHQIGGRVAGVYISMDKGKPYRQKSWSIDIRGRADFQLVMSSLRRPPPT